MNSFRYSFDHVYEYDGRVFVCERDLHFTGSCSLHEIKEENGELILLTIFEYGYLNFSGYCFENNYMYFYSTGMRNGLYKLNLDNYELSAFTGDYPAASMLTVYLKRKISFISMEAGI